MFFFLVQALLLTVADKLLIRQQSPPQVATSKASAVLTTSCGFPMLPYMPPQAMSLYISSFVYSMSFQKETKLSDHLLDMHFTACKE